MIRDVVLQTYFYILNNIDEIQPYLSTHKRLFKIFFPKWVKLLSTEHDKCFINLINERFSKDNCASKIIKWMSYMLKFNVIIWSAYDISKCSFYIISKDAYSIMRNSGVMVEAESIYFSNSKYKNHAMTSRSYFGVFEEI